MCETNYKLTRLKLSGVLPALLALMPCYSIAQISDDLTISGFGNITAGYLDTDQANFKGHSDDVSLKSDSLIGLQASYEFTPALSATIQGILHADSEDNDSIINWAYASWQPDDNLLIKAGRQRTPFFALSDVLDVGYAYPWITAPIQVYSAWLFPTFDGVDLAWGYSTGEVDTTFEGYVGRYDGEIELSDYSTDYTIDIFGGLITKVNWKDFEFRASFHRGKVDIGLTEIDTLKSGLALAGFTASADALSREGWIEAKQLSVSYDNLDYFARAEWVLIESDLSIAAEIESYYLMGGYNFYPFSVHFTYAESQVDYPTFPDEIPSYYAPLYEGWNEIMDRLSNDSLRSWTLGTRWDVLPKVALKAEVTLLDGDSEENSFFDSIEEGFDRDASLYKLSVEWVF
ncbi:hypothetical protein ACWU4D_16400 [Vibrio sp. WJH972]